MLRQAIATTGLTHRDSADTVLLIDERTVRYWLAAERSIPGPVRDICRAIVGHPVVWNALSRAASRPFP